MMMTTLEQIAAAEVRRAAGNNLGNELAYLLPYVTATASGDVLAAYARLCEAQRTLVRVAARAAEEGGG